VYVKYRGENMTSHYAQEREGRISMVAGILKDAQEKEIEIVLERFIAEIQLRTGVTEKKVWEYLNILKGLGHIEIAEVPDITDPDKKIEVIRWKQ